MNQCAANTSLNLTCRVLRPLVGTLPMACAVVEDTPTGVAAGMSVYGYSALTPAHHLKDAGAQYIFNSMSELPSLLLEGAHRA